MKKISSLFLIVVSLIMVFSSCNKKNSEYLVLELQPDGETGNDAQIWSSMSDNNSGNSAEFQAMAWTWDALNLPEGKRRSLIDFDLSEIPSDAKIKSAYLSLFHNSETVEPIGGHSKLSGSNSCFLKRITESWEEGTVTWNNQPATTSENQVTIEESNTLDQNYENIDITALVQDMISDPNSSFGIMLQLQTEVYYRAILFASGDMSVENKRPKLKLEYKVKK